MHKIGYLDGLRGCAALIVVLHHFAAAFFPATYLGLDAARHSSYDTLFLVTPAGLLTAGNFSVCIFFILSGYVLTIRFFRTGERALLVRSALRRYFRLLPPVALSMALAWLFMKAGLFRNAEAAALSGSDRWLALCWNFPADAARMAKDAFWGVFFDHRSDYNNVLWTMTYEVFGSFLVFGAAALFGGQKGRWIFYAASAYLFMDSYYVAFLLGLVLADTHANKPRVIEALGAWPLGLALAGAGLFLGTYPTFPDVTKTMYAFLETKRFDDPAVSYHIIGAFLVMLATLSSKPLQAAFDSRVPRFLGRVSFSMYAIHVLVVGSFSCALLLALRGLPYLAAAGITFAATLALLLPLAALVDRWVDRPGIALSRTIQERFFPVPGKADR